ncbi:RagB/SusD family nutrient uptake outer membrane protein [Mucilaginibacter sp. dw_454]|uniref:RagB/SusD family nutrient uptake outer membrane protein n=1 Tax=Mucilaginibacter sp. dw_454 TaxID=2720079 RepID=UPI001BD5AE8A|nr:RagB/SusD family nutrient uptake outer membrane protein [Mucilaginibacter sp. dw_454]
MKNIKYLNLLVFGLPLFCFTSCKKYLDAKPNISLEIPNTVADLQAILNYGVHGSTTAQIGSDDYYTPYPQWQSINGTFNQDNYYWNLPNLQSSNGDWEILYSDIFNQNVVLDNISTVSLGNQSADTRDQVKAQALFNRAFLFFEVEKIFGQPYKPATANTDLGICLRTTSSVTAPSSRATVQQSYNQIISDLRTGVAVLSQSVPAQNLATKQAAYDLLARVYLSMEDYKNALTAANSALAIQNKLLDFNTLNPSTTYPMPTPRTNNEIVFYTNPVGAGSLTSSHALVDTLLYASYSDNDLRKTIYFKHSALGGYTFNGGYEKNQEAYTFSGLATDELYLIKAECEARAGNVNNAAMNDLNALLVTRWKAGTFVPYTAASATDALNQILLERRKELIWRGIRWDDLRRLNQDPNYAVTLKRNLNGIVYSLPPDDPHYAFLLPPDVIQLGGVPQNPR